MVKEIKQKAKESDSALVLGLDCEGISKESPLSLIQVAVDKDVYVIDLFKVDPFDYGLKEIMESQYIVKVFHDF